VGAGGLQPHWSGSRCVSRLDASQFRLDSTRGLDEFSHLEVGFRLHLVEGNEVELTSRRPRANDGTDNRSDGACRCGRSGIWPGAEAG
jgi:hypothetical protein